MSTFSVPRLSVLLLGLILALPQAGHASNDPLKSLLWLSGQWVGREGPTRTEQHFMKPGDGVMLGMRRSMSPSRGADTEFMRIVAQPDGSVIYYGQPLGSREVIPYTLIESGNNMAVFANTEHGYPQRIVFNRYGGNVVAALEGPDGNGGVRRFRWTWKRAGDAP
ncbi:DUF6265 family protein [Niveispirillum sp. KHB5.9]|uniref:DUF6265 family protein n=1 Tax=Niveispirillum sp. KHB5.9 TaxID=3400269 RepID=UPI003A8C1634